MPARIIDGRAVADALRAEVARDVLVLKSRGVAPGLAVVLVGDDPASSVYVRSKARQSTETGIASYEHRLAGDVAEATLLSLVQELNANAAVHGILVQLPLPPHIDARKVLRLIDPKKDVDGFHPENVGLLSVGEAALAPCTPIACIRLLGMSGVELAGAEAVVVGRSNIVGKPVAQLLLAQNCTVTVCHSQSRDLAQIVGRADIVIAAVGRPEFIRGAWIKPGAAVIDVGINRVVRDGRPALVGDVAFDEARLRAGVITPVPGGVGPMTIACLLANTVAAARAFNA